MPSEYEALVSALQATGIPFAEYGWKTRPEGAYGVVSLDYEAGSCDGDGVKCDRSWEASVDLFFAMLSDRNVMVPEIESVLTDVCGDAWEMNSLQHETAPGLFHIEWVCRVTNDGS